MKTLIFKILFILVILIPVISSAEEPVIINQGRYQIIQGTHYSDKLVFKIDTQTGKTWVFAILTEMKDCGWFEIKQFTVTPKSSDKSPRKPSELENSDTK